MELSSIEPAAAGAVGLGLFVVLAGLATLVGMPWQYATGGVLLAVLRALGALLTVAVGIAVTVVALRRSVGPIEF